MTANIIYERIKEQADKQNLSLRQLSIKSGFKSPSAISRYKQGVTPTDTAVKAIAGALGVSVDYLLGNTDEMHPTSTEQEVPNDLEEVLKQVNPVMFGGAELTDDQKMLLYNMAKEMSRNNQQGGK